MLNTKIFVPGVDMFHIVGQATVALEMVTALCRKHIIQQNKNEEIYTGAF